MKGEKLSVKLENFPWGFGWVLRSCSCHFSCGGSLNIKVFQSTYVSLSSPYRCSERSFSWHFASLRSKSYCRQNWKRWLPFIPKSRPCPPKFRGLTPARKWKRHHSPRANLPLSNPANQPISTSRRYLRWSGKSNKIKTNKKSVNIFSTELFTRNKICTTFNHFRESIGQVPNTTSHTSCNTLKQTTTHFRHWKKLKRMTKEHDGWLKYGNKRTAQAEKSEESIRLLKLK